MNRLEFRHILISFHLCHLRHPNPGIDWPSTFVQTKQDILFYKINEYDSR